MLSVGNHIAHLLHHHECVIIPDFGGFIGNKKDGFLNQKDHLFHPSYLQVSFNKNLINNDGLLANQVSKSEGVDYQEANAFIQTFKDACYAKLNEEGRLEIEKVGVLFFDEEKNIQFQQSSKNYLLSSFGLQPQFIQPLVQEEVKVVPIPTKQEKLVARVATTKVDRPAEKVEKQAKKVKRNRARRGLAYGLLVPVFIGGIFLGNQLTLVNRGDVNLSAFGGFIQPNIKTYTPREIVTPIQSTDTTETPAQTEVKPKSIIEVNEPSASNTAEVTAEPVTSKNLNYHVIAGCFGDKSNAEDFVSENKANGYASQIIDKKGSLYRVSIQSFETRKEAIALKNELKNQQDLSSWVLKK